MVQASPYLQNALLPGTGRSASFVTTGTPTGNALLDRSEKRSRLNGVQNNPAMPMPITPRSQLPHAGSGSFYDQARRIDMQLRSSPKDRAAIGDRVSTLAGLLGTLSRRPDLTKNSVLKAGAEAVKRGDVSADEVQKFLSNAPQNPKVLREYVDRSFADMLMASVHLSTDRDPTRGR